MTLNPGGGLSGRILPPSKSSSAEREALVQSDWRLKSNSKSCSAEQLGDLGMPGFSSQRKGTAEGEPIGTSSSWRKKLTAREEGLVGALREEKGVEGAER
ncbi:hypothetical protein SDJN03_30071, partial [Cucurbita argyrosperma subsp. sororia]